MSYLALNALFLVVVAVLLVVTAALMRGRFPWRETGIVLVVMLFLTAVFDNVIIGVGLVAYDDTLLSGLRIGLAPVEDFAYTVAVTAIVSCVWMLTERRGKK